MQKQSKQKAIPSSISREDVAIIGQGLRFPKSNSLNEFWKHLEAEHSMISEVSPERWNKEEYFGNPRKDENKTNSIWGGFIEDADCFDADFFNISPREAESMDPQQRMAMELSWKAIEDAGYKPSSLAGTNTGVFMGVCHWDYAELLERDVEEVDAYFPTGVAYSIISNRVSYFFDFKGPSITNDTACASSLVSMYEAVRSIQNGECEYALAGGVNLCWSPKHFIAFSKNGMLSKDGKCKAFDDSANGYVRGEGGGVLLLKSLSQAIKDNDPIYAVIKGVGTNHGGRTTSLTVTNPGAQADLIVDIYQKAGVTPETVTYIEAHGPGTPIGDPIEVLGLKKAFGRLEENTGIDAKKVSCGLGSVKTNIGHLEGAAGVAGVIKVIASMRNKILPGTVNFEKLNSVINFENSPFYVIDKSQPWEPKTPEGLPMIRRAGISSFGFGGSNAHILLEEYISETMSSEKSNEFIEERAYIIPLSAKNEERLLNVVEDLLIFLKNNDTLSKTNTVDIQSLEYTLLQGREAMEERVIFLVNSIDDLILKLGNFVNNEEKIEGCWRGNSHQRNDNLSLISNDDDFDELVCKWMDKRILDKISKLWIQGVSIQWDRLHKDLDIQKLRLPTYPFAKEKHWYNVTTKKESDQSKKNDKLHPLIHKNTSTLKIQRFTSTFKSDDFFLADHKIKGNSVLPGVAYLEMARAALALAIDRPIDDLNIELRDIVWIRPFILKEENKQIHISLNTRNEEPISFEVYSQESEGDEIVVFCKGQVKPLISQKESLNLTAIKSSFTKASFDQESCYKIIRKTDQIHGKRLQGLRTLYLDKRQALAKIELPFSEEDKSSDFVMHPAIMDSIMQTSVILLLGEEQIEWKKDKMDAALPFSMESVEIVSPFENTMWTFVRYEEGSNPEDDFRKLEMFLLNTEGNVCVKIKGYSARVISDTPRAQKTFDSNPSQGILKAEKNLEKNENESTGLVFTTNFWKTKELNNSREIYSRIGISTSLILIGTGTKSVEILSENLGLETALFAVKESNLEKENVSYVFKEVFEHIQGILKSRPKIKQRLLVVLPDSPGNYLYASIAALFKTAQLENPKIEGKIILVSKEYINDDKFLEHTIKEEAKANVEEVEIRYTDSRNREVRYLSTFDLESEEAPVSKIKKGGVYWITGGLGGLGNIFSNYISSFDDVNLILNGRSPLQKDKQNQLNELRAKGATVTYIQADITDKSAVERIVNEILEVHGTLDGIFHCAGIVKDAYILTKSIDQIQDVFKPKVDGIFHIDTATKKLDLDFIVLFSSIAVHGNIGQADYAGANAVLDAFAAYRNMLTSKGDRKGKTVAINWPLWGSGGMSADSSTIQQMYNEKGILPLPTHEGILALERVLLADNYANIGVIFGDKTKILNDYNSFVKDDLEILEMMKEEVENVSSKVSDKDLKKRTIKFLKEILGKCLRLDPKKIQEDQKLSEYGLDSIVIIDTTSELEDVFGQLSKTLFFEYVDIQGLVEYFIEEHKEKLIEILDLSPSIEKIQAEASVKDYKEKLDVNSSSRFQEIPDITNEKTTSKSTTKKKELRADSSYHDIAIVGVGGKYPEADTLEDFWDNLSQGKDSFQKVPSERWEHNEIYHNERDILGKSTIKTGAFIDDIDKFDPRYFSISQLQAELMSPEVRLFLEVGVEALEDAGYSKEYLQKKYNGDVGVLVGTMSNHYYLYGVQNMLTRGSMANGSYTGTIPNMLSYYYGFTGPSIFLDTMCSGSSTCIHQAVQMLRSGECKMMVVGGMSLLLHPYHFISSSQEHYTTKTADIIRSYGLGADGTILGEGVGAMVLKPLVEAQKDGDHIYGVIKGTGLANAGIRNGFTVPNPHNQALAIDKAIKDANIDPRTISYVEGHGSGTALGDPIEIKGIASAYKKYTDDLQFCPIGSVKSNIAHLLGAAGIAGLTKVLLQFRHKKLVPSLHADEINPSINFEATPFYVNKELSEWKQPVFRINGVEEKFPRRAGITSIGAGGMNSHIIVEEYNDITINDQYSTGERKLMVFSAMNSKVLKIALNKFRNYVSNISEAELTAVAYTLQVGKNELPCRLAICVNTLKELQDNLDSCIEYIDQPQRLKNNSNIHYLPSILERNTDLDSDDVDELMKNKNVEKIGLFWVNGIKIDWDMFYGSFQPKRVSLPSYPFEKVRCWYEVYDDAPTLQNPLASKSKLHPFIGENLSDLNGIKYSASIQLDTLLDYVYTIKEVKQILPSFIIDTAFALGNISGLDNGFTVEELTWNSPLDWETVESLEIFLLSERNGKHAFYLETRNDRNKQRICTGLFRVNNDSPIDSIKHLELGDLIDNANKKVNTSEFYFLLGEAEISYAPYLESTVSGYLNTNRELLLQITPLSLKQDFYKSNIAFTSEVLGALLQGFQYWAGEYNISGWKQIALQTIKEIELVSSSSEVEYIHFRIQSVGDEIVGEVCFTDKYGKVTAILKGVSFNCHFNPMNLRSEQIENSKNIDTNAEIEEKSIKEKLINYLKEKVSKLSKFQISNIDERAHFYSFGFESIAILKLSDIINKELSTQITPAIFFQCENIKELAEYISNNNESNNKSFFIEDVVQTINTSNEGGNIKNTNVKDRLLHLLRKYVADIVKFNIEDIDILNHFYSFGFESIALAKLAVAINKELGTDLTPALFFQCENINELAMYLLKNNEEQLKAVLDEKHLLGIEKSKLLLSNKANLILDSEKTVIKEEVVDVRVKNNSDRQIPIAIIGAAGKLPQSDDLNHFWENINEGKNLVSDFPIQRFNEFYQKVIKEAQFPKRAGTINDVDRFDADFFNISPLEAELMDPQHRLVLECTWNALEDAGYIQTNLPENTGVFFGVTGKDYQSLLTAHSVPVDAFTATGNSHSMLVNRLSFMLDIHGASESIDTACSSSLVAISRAIERIISGACDIAIAGGVNLVLSTDDFVGPHLGGMLSPDGNCKTFSKEANGYVRGEGVGAIVLKSLEQAEKDGDNILGVVIGSAINHGGRASSLTAPNAKSQAKLIEHAMRGIEPHTISYIETHGTGTSLGDPVEVNGLKLAFDNLTQTYSHTNVSKKKYCALGSVKSNIGHLEAAAGIAGVLKVLSAMKHNILPASLHSKEINPFIELENSPFYILQKRQDWFSPLDDFGNVIPRRAGISSFGFGGTNAHLVIEEYNKKRKGTNINEPQLVIFSAKNRERLIQIVNNMDNYLKTTTDNILLSDIAYTLQIGREAMEERLAIVAESKDDLRVKLKTFLNNSQEDTVFSARVKTILGNRVLLNVDESMLKTTNEWIASKSYLRLAEFWVNGGIVEWKKIHAGQHHYKISLPTYPFKKDSYWIPEPYYSRSAKGIKDNKIGSSEVTSEDSFDEIFYTELINRLSDNTMSIDDAMKLANNVV